MQDRETGSWWQQISGKAVQGPLKGRSLKLVDHDELTFKTWREEVGKARVLRPDPKIAAAGDYAPPDWEDRIAKYPVLTDAGGENARMLIVGVKSGENSNAYPVHLLEKQNPIQDSLGAVPICVVLSTDRKSVRAFDRRIEGRTLNFFRKIDTKEYQMVDSETGSHWNFAGKAIAGPLNGKQLQKIQALKDFWFDWRLYNPNTLIYKLN